MLPGLQIQDRLLVEKLHLLITPPEAERSSSSTPSMLFDPA